MNIRHPSNRTILRIVAALTIIFFGLILRFAFVQNTSVFMAVSLVACLFIWAYLTLLSVYSVYPEHDSWWRLLIWLAYSVSFSLYSLVPVVVITHMINDNFWAMVIFIGVWFANKHLLEHLEEKQTEQRVGVVHSYLEVSLPKWSDRFDVLVCEADLTGDLIRDELQAFINCYNHRTHYLFPIYRRYYEPNQEQLDALAGRYIAVLEHSLASVVGEDRKVAMRMKYRNLFKQAFFTTSLP